MSEDSILLSTLSKVIAQHVPPTAHKLHKRLKKAGYPTYIVGGWVRNIILASIGFENQTHLKPNSYKWGDIDFTTAAEPHQVISLFSHTHPTGIKHGTVTVHMDDDAFEVTTFRQEGKYSNNRHPDDVTFSKSLEEDLFRRDFTFNALAFEPENHDLIDRFDGISDLKKKILRVITNPPEPPASRFEEDALRMMRACRFAAQFGFVIEPKTLEAINKSAYLIKTISYERIRDELIKLVVAPETTIGIEYLRTTGIMSLVLPELANTFAITQNCFHAYDVYYHSLKVLESLNRLQRNLIEELGKKENANYQLSLAGLFHDIAKPQTKTVDKSRVIEGIPHVTFYRHEIIGANITHKTLKRLKFSTKDINMVSHLVRHHMFYYTSKWKDGTIRRFVSRIGQKNLKLLFLLRQADRLGKGPPDYQEDNQDLEELQQRINLLITKKSFLTLNDLAINGEILVQELTLTPGPKIGYLLKQLLERVLDDPQQNQKDLLLKSAKKLLAELNDSPDTLKKITRNKDLYFEKKTIPFKENGVD